MMQGEKIASDLREAQEAVGGNHSPVPALAAAVRRLERRAANSPALVEPAVKAIDIAINALEEADQHLSAALVAADFDPAELERIEERLFALRAASRKYSTPVDGLAALAAKYRLRRRADRCRRRTVEEAGSRGRRGRQALRRGGREAVRGRADKVRRQSSTRPSTPNCAPLKLERAKFMTQVETDASLAGAAGHRPRRVLGADQSRHPAGPADEGRLRRRAVALPAGAEGGAVRPRLGAHAGVRRNRYRRRRRGGGRHRRAAGAARRQGPGDGGDACAAGRRARQPASADFQGRARQGQARRHPRQRARRRPPPRGNRPHAGGRGDHRGGGAAAERLLRAAANLSCPGAMQRSCAAPQSRDPPRSSVDPGSAAHHSCCAGRGTPGCPSFLQINFIVFNAMAKTAKPKLPRRRQAHQGPGQGRAHAAFARDRGAQRALLSEGCADRVGCGL